MAKATWVRFKSIQQNDYSEQMTSLQSNVHVHSSRLSMVSRIWLAGNDLPSKKRYNSGHMALPEVFGCFVHTCHACTRTPYIAHF